MGTSSSSSFDTAKLVGTFKGPLSSKYEIIKQLGAGAQGAAYLVKYKGDASGKYVAKSTHDTSQDGRAEFLEEFNKMRDMHHPNCSKVIELVDGKEFVNGEWRDELYVITELASGSDLHKYMGNVVASGVPMTEEWVAGVYQQAMQGVAYIHSKGIVHNDLKPDNILMLEAFDPNDPARVPWVVVNDFGCATLLKDNFFRCGDPRYQAPESWATLLRILEGETASWAKLDAKADVWSMGATLFELLSGGLLPFIYTACTVSDLVGEETRMIGLGHAVMHDPIEIRRYCPGISAEAEDLLQKVFAKDVSRRMSAQEVLQHQWFYIKGKPVADAVTSKLHFNVLKGKAHAILMNALAMKLQRAHYEACWEIFREIDTDESGFINLEEFQGAYTKLKDGADPTEARAVFQRADIDRSGTLDFNEFMAVTFEWDSLDRAALVGDLRTLIACLDADGSGDLDHEELSTLFRGTLPLAELEEVFHQIDTDGNGKITVQEMQRFLFEPATEEELEKLAERASSRSIQAGGADRNKAVTCSPETCLGTVLPALACLCVSWHGILNLL